MKRWARSLHTQMGKLNTEKPLDLSALFVNRNLCRVCTHQILMPSKFTFSAKLICDSASITFFQRLEVIHATTFHISGALVLSPTKLAKSCITFLKHLRNRTLNVKPQASESLTAGPVYTISINLISNAA